MENTEPVALLINIANRTDAARYFKFMKNIPLIVAEKSFLLTTPPVLLSKLARIEADGKNVPGCVIGVPLTPRMLKDQPYEVVQKKVWQAVQLAQSQGAKVIVLTGLMGGGALGEQLIKDFQALPSTRDVVFSTGNGYTAAVIAASTLLAARQRGVDLAQSRIAIVGAAGSIGQGVLEALLRQQTFGEVMVFATTRAAAGNMARHLNERGIPATGHADMDDLVDADIVVTATNKPRPIIFSPHLKRGAIVCDAAVPIAVDKSVRRERPDLFLFQGGAVIPPSATTPDFGFDFGLPPATGYACMNEGFLLALSNRQELATTTKRIPIENILEFDTLAKQYGFQTVIKHFTEGTEEDEA